MTATAVDAPAPTDRRRWPLAISGLVATAVALGATEVLAGVVAPVPSLVQAVGNGVIDLGAGTPVKDIAIALFGTNEKSALVIGTVILALLFGTGLGLASRHSLVPATVGFTAFALLGLGATFASPLDSAAWAILPAAVAVVSGVALLRYLLQLDQRVRVAGSRATSPEAKARADRGRRDFLRVAVGLAAVGGVLGALGRSLTGRSQTSAVRSTVILPEAVPAPVAEASTSLDVDGISPLFTPNEQFYRIDTALMSPTVDVETWSLRIHGLVDRGVELTYDDLLAMDQFEGDVTIACVSNEVGGDLIGTARWQGVRLSEVLDLAGVDAEQATQIVGRSVDGWTAGFPTELAFDGRNAMVAVAMNGEPLPVDHGFPARLIVPGIYGYVSATKWLSEIELTTWEQFDGYWIPRGWAKEGPIKTQSRIDVPRGGAQVSAGEVAIAGVAWAQQRGVDRVEVSIDGGQWREAELADAVNIDTWRQWVYRWDAAPGEHQIRVRATDATGETQSEDRVPVAPDGAEGYHTRVVRVA
ncbi:molybdopterin-dependent oxidoreductase [Euzebya tangerina]|uniref:molybdopterin-dependent oxidoreductase n=1 Tax=Euzebya tangerina TaxID=591198 RepID=UPI000E31696B|nr:molybdopterin-dependent oxidoreductase [Euzebya tangerina]